MKHLHKVGSDPYLYSDSGYSDLTNHPKLQSGWEIVDGLPPDDAQRFENKGLLERLNDIFTAQDVSLRAQFAPLKAAVYVAINDGDIEAAAAVIQGQTIDPSLETVRQALLAEFN